MLSALLPCFNEADGIARLAEELFPSLERLGRPYEVLFIDDGSTDGTADSLAALSSRRPEARVETHPENRGLGAALRTGFARARGEWIAVLDADLTFHPDLLPALFARQQETGADCVSGSPFLSSRTSIGIERRLPSLLLNVFYRGLLDRRLTSFTPLFRLYRTAALRELELNCDGFEISVEILAGLLRNKKRVAEVPSPLTTRRTGASKLRYARELRNHFHLIWRLLKAGSVLKI